MAILGEIRKRSWLMLGVIALALLAFLVNPDSIDTIFGKDPSVLGKVNGDEITRAEFDDQLFILQQQAQNNGMPNTGLEEQTWQSLIQSKLIKQQFDKLGLNLTDDYFWSQVQYDPMFAQNQQFFDQKGNFKLQEIRKTYEGLESTSPHEYNQWLKVKKSIEYRMMAKQLFTNISGGITANKKEVEELMKERGHKIDIDYVQINYIDYLKKNPIKVSTEDLLAFIKERPNSFKTEASRNLGIAYFPAKASAGDDAKVLAEINKLNTVGTDNSGGKENFQNTENDSMFVALNSDKQFNPIYLKKEQLPAAIADKIVGASIGQSFGPYKDQDAYVVTKLVDKKPSDSTLSKHILIAFVGSPAGNDVKRTKEQAKKLADSIGAIVKASPNKFKDFLSLSNDPGSAANGGSLGWTTPETPFVPAFLKYLNSNPKGATGVVETQFGYHIIHIDDKKPGKMAYQLANLVKDIKPSQETENLVDKNARRFNQRVEAKSFTEFSNIAIKDNYQFLNPKFVKRFDGQIQGLNSGKEVDIITWAFDKKTKKGDVQFFVSEGTGDRIVVILNAVQEAGMADPQNVRQELEPIVKNKLAAKQIIQKLQDTKVQNLDDIAKTYGTTKQVGQVNPLNPVLGMNMEPKVAGAALGVAKGKLSQPIEGNAGVYVLVKKSETKEKTPGDVKQISEAIANQNKQMFGQQLLRSLQDNAKIEDFRIEVWNKVQGH